MAEFMSPYGTQKILAGVIPANETVRPNWLQTFFGNVRTSNERTVNFDVEFATNNTMGMYVAPTADVVPVDLPDFGHKELHFAYAKEGLNSPDYDEINTRQLGQNFSSVNPAQNEIINIRTKLALAQQRFENLHELNAANLIFTGQHTAQSEKHSKVIYDLGRNKPATPAAAEISYMAGGSPELDLTTLVGNGGAGKRAWDATGGTKPATPVKDLMKMVALAGRRRGVSAVIMSSGAYELLEADINANYAKAADMQVKTSSVIDLKVLPEVEKYQDLNFRRMMPLGNGPSTHIYTYDAVYHDRDTGVETAYVPAGYVACVPDPRYGIKVYGRIIHPKAKYKAMPRWLHSWENAKTGKKEWEFHMNYLMGHRDADSLVSWKVMG